MDWQEYIISDPAVLYGKPVIRGTRVPVDLILEKLGAGETVAELLEAYPGITKESINACLFFASDSIKNELVTGIK